MKEKIFYIFIVLGLVSIAVVFGLSLDQYFIYAAPIILYFIIYKVLLANKVNVLTFILILTAIPSLLILLTAILKTLCPVACGEDIGYIAVYFIFFVSYPFAIVLSIITCYIHIKK